MLRPAWLLHWLNHGHQLTAIAAYRYEANASSGAAVCLFMRDPVPGHRAGHERARRGLHPSRSARARRELPPGPRHAPVTSECGISPQKRPCTRSDASLAVTAAPPIGARGINSRLCSLAGCFPVVIRNVVRAPDVKPSSGQPGRNRSRCQALPASHRGAAHATGCPPRPRGNPWLPDFEPASRRRVWSARGPGGTPSWPVPPRCPAWRAWPPGPGGGGSCRRERLCSQRGAHPVPKKPSAANTAEKARRSAQGSPEMIGSGGRGARIGEGGEPARRRPR